MDQRLGYEECQDGADLMNLINQRRILGWRFYIEALHRLTASGGTINQISPVIFPKAYMEKLIDEDPDALQKQCGVSLPVG